MDRHETQARATALQIAIRQSDSQAIAHLEAIVGAMLLAMTGPVREGVFEEMSGIENLPPETLTLVQLYGEIQAGQKPQRQAWRDELTTLEEQLQAAPPEPLEPEPQPVPPEPAVGEE